MAFKADSSTDRPMMSSVTNTSNWLRCGVMGVRWGGPVTASVGVRLVDGSDVTMHVTAGGSGVFCNDRSDDTLVFGKGRVVQSRTFDPLPYSLPCQYAADRGQLIVERQKDGVAGRRRNLSVQAFILRLVSALGLTGAAARLHGVLHCVDLGGCAVRGCERGNLWLH